MMKEQVGNLDNSSIYLNKIIIWSKNMQKIIFLKVKIGKIWKVIIEEINKQKPPNIRIIKMEDRTIWEKIENSINMTITENMEIIIEDKVIIEDRVIITIRGLITIIMRINKEIMIIKVIIE